MILIDTHVLLWLESGSTRLGRRAKKSIDQALADSNLYISAISFWEIAMLVRRGRLEITDSLDTWLEKSSLEQGLRDVPVSSQIALKAGSLPNLHGDPADRIIVATALNGYRLLTADKKLLSWPGKLDRADACL